MQDTDMTQRFTITHYVPGTPRQAWDAWTNPAAIAQWWHLPQTTTPVHGLEYDVRVGGLHICTSIHDESGEPDGFWWRVSHEVLPPRRLVFTWVRRNCAEIICHS